MQYRRFGRTGWNVSEIGYGMWDSPDGPAPTTPNRSTPCSAPSISLQFLRHRRAYGEGHSEQILGKVLRANAAKKLYVATKFRQES